MKKKKKLILRLMLHLMVGRRKGIFSAHFYGEYFCVDDKRYAFRYGYVTRGIQQLSFNRCRLSVEDDRMNGLGMYVIGVEREERAVRDVSCTFFSKVHFVWIACISGVLISVAD